MLERAVDGTWFRTTHHLAMRIDCVRCAAAAKRSQIDHFAVAPQEGVVILTAGEIGVANNFARIVDPAHPTVIASQSAQIAHDSVFPEKGMNDVVATQGRSPSYLTPVVHTLTVVEHGAPEGSEIDHIAVVPEKGMCGPRLHKRQSSYQVVALDRAVF